MRMKREREKMRSDEELESLVRRNAWNSKLQGRVCWDGGSREQVSPGTK